MTLSLQVYIPTRNRVGLNKQVTLREFKSKSTHVPVLVCRPNEARAHSAYHSRVVACPADGIGPTRQWILDTADSDIVVMADDDMRFNYRPDPTVPKLEVCPDLTPLLSLVERCVEDGFMYGGLSPRQGNNRVNDGESRGVMDRGHLFVDCYRCINFHYFDRQRVRSSGVKLYVGVDSNGVQLVMEDFYVTLSLLTRGHANRVIYDYAWNQEGSGRRGGCSDYRTPEVQSAWCRYLEKSFPAFVKVIEKESKASSQSWKGLKSRTDVIVSWLKAYQYGTANRRPVPKRRSVPCPSAG